MTPAQKKVIEEANSRAQILQPEKHYSEDYEIWHKVVPYLDLAHPFYSTLDLHWTGSGDWQDIPKKPGQVIKEDEDIEKYNMARKEPYVTPEGETKLAIANGIRPSELNVWYHLDEV